MEGDINTTKRNSSETTLENNVTLSLLLLEGTIVAVVHDVLEHLLNFCETEFLSQLDIGHD